MDRFNCATNIVSPDQSNDEEDDDNTVEDQSNEDDTELKIDYLKV